MTIKTADTQQKVYTKDFAGVSGFFNLQESAFL